MDWRSFVRHAAVYTVVLGGGSIGICFLFPSFVRLYAVLSMTGVGLFLAVWGLVSEDGPKAGGIPLVNARGLGMRSTGPPGLFYAAGLLLFGMLALVPLLGGY